MIAILLVATAALYGWGVWKTVRMGRRFPWRAAASFATGLTIVGVVLNDPLDHLADAALSWHMVQHLVLMSVVAPLLLLGAPLRLALAVLPKRGATLVASLLNSSPVRALTHPVFAWLQFAAVLYIAHFSPLYEAALERPAVHVLEHLMFVTSALIFWFSLLEIAPAPHTASHPVRILSAFMALPMGAFLGFIFYVTMHVLYAHYAVHADALADQMNAGAVMWIAGGTPLLIVLLWLVGDWGARERRFESIIDDGYPGA